MVSIVDAGPLYRLVQIGSGPTAASIQIFGIKFVDLVPMLDRFPELRKVLTPGRDGEVDKDAFSFEGIMKMGPRILGAAIAASMGRAGDEKAEEWAMSLPIGIQVEIMKDVIEITFPKGLAAFADDLRSMGLLGKAEPEVVNSKPNGHAEDQPSAARGKEAVMKSLSQSGDSSTRTTML